MGIGLQNHGDVLPSFYGAVEVCAYCGEESKVLFDGPEGSECGYCKEKMAEARAQDRLTDDQIEKVEGMDPRIALEVFVAAAKLLKACKRSEDKEIQRAVAETEAKILEGEQYAA